MQKFTKEDFLSENSLERTFLGEIGGVFVEERRGVIFLTSNAIKHILEKVTYSEKYILYKLVQAKNIYGIKIAQVDKVYTTKSSLDDQNKYQKQQLRWAKYIVQKLMEMFCT